MQIRSPAQVFAFLTALTALAGCSSGRSRPATIPHAARADRELTLDQQVRHVLNRLAFGARPGDPDRVRALGVDRWIEQQLEPDRIQDSLDGSILARFPAVSLPPSEAVQIEANRTGSERRLRERRKLLLPGDTLSDSPVHRAIRADSVAHDSATRRTQRLLSDLQEAKVARAVVSDRQLLEVMVDFWENHFSVFSGKGPVRYMLLEYDRDVIRPRALGRFRDLLHAVARSPAMLYYLDNVQSGVEPDRPTLGGLLAQRKALIEHRRTIPPLQFGRPGKGLNENYARELLELHTMGVDGGYTQQDVVNVARAFTGWSVQEPEKVGQFLFRPEQHDAGAKRILGHKFIAGRGIEEGEEVLDLLADLPATAHFIAKKLVRRFVSDSANPGLTDRAARVFLDTKGDIREVVRAIVTSPEFFARSAYRAKVKSPFELVVSALRVANASIDTTLRPVQSIAQLGQPLFGHLAPNGYPETGEEWINTGTIASRINFGLSVASTRFASVNWPEWIDRAGIRVSERAAQVDAVLDQVLGGEASEVTRDVLTRGINPLAPPTGMPDSAGRGRRLAMDSAGLLRMVGLALGAPEFQRR